MAHPVPELRRIVRDIVSAVVVSSDDCILFGRKDPSKGGVYSDSWHLPGGGTDGEPQLFALARELNQETHLRVEGLATVLLDDKGTGNSIKVLGDGEKVNCHMRFFVYLVTHPQSSTEIQVSPGDDLIELQWVPRTALQSLTLTPPSRQLFTRLGWIAG